MPDFSEISSGDTMMCRLSRSVGVRFSSFSSDGSLILLIPFDPEQFRHSDDEEFSRLKRQRFYRTFEYLERFKHFVEHSTKK